MSLWQGKRQEARGKSEEGLGDFTFLYTVWFYCVHLLMIADDCRKMTESARIGSNDNSDGLSWVRGMGLPSSQVAKSVGNVSARNLQVLSYILWAMQAGILLNNTLFEIDQPKISIQLNQQNRCSSPHRFT